MRLSQYRLLVSFGVIIAGVAACDLAPVFGGCSDDLYTRVDPPSRDLRIGESYVAEASAWGCGQTKQLTDEWRYFAVDTAVAGVDSLTGRVTARAAGTTDVGARGRRYHDAATRSRVTVTP